MGTIFVSEMLNKFEETFVVTEMRTLRHEPFFFVCCGWRGAGHIYFKVGVSCLT